jgi:hypothetical protein
MKMKTKIQILIGVSLMVLGVNAHAQGITGPSSATDYVPGWDIRVTGPQFGQSSFPVLPPIPTSGGDSDTSTDTPPGTDGILSGFAGSLGTPFQSSGATAFATSAVPEPSSLALLTTTAVGAAALRLRRKR